MIGYRCLRITAFLVLVGFIAVCSIAVGGTAINIGQGIISKNAKSIDQFNDWNTDWQWGPAALVPTSSEAYQRSDRFELFIAYHEVSNLIYREGHPPDRSTGKDHRGAENDRSSQNSSDFQSVATHLHIQF